VDLNLGVGDLAWGLGPWALEPSLCSVGRVQYVKKLDDTGCWWDYCCRLQQLQFPGTSHYH